MKVLIVVSTNLLIDFQISSYEEYRLSFVLVSLSSLAKPSLARDPPRFWYQCESVSRDPIRLHNKTLQVTAGQKLHTNLTPLEIIKRSWLEVISFLFPAVFGFVDLKWSPAKPLATSLHLQKPRWGCFVLHHKNRCWGVWGSLCRHWLNLILLLKEIWI